MANTYGFNWSWVAAVDETKNESGAVYQGGGTIFSFRQPAKGAISSSDLTAFSRSVAQNLQNVRSDWRTYIRPVLNSLPAGSLDTRWSTQLGTGLPEKINCLTYGVQGSTLFVFNDANSTKADGRYWHSSDLRPKTIAEKFEDVYEAISDLSTSLASNGGSDLDPLWAAIGEAYRDSDRATSVGSLDSRVGTTETYLSQLNNDIYDPTTFPSYQLGAPLPYSIADMLDSILKLHNVAGWGSDPSTANHSAVLPADHTHPFDEVTPTPAISNTQGRSGTHVNLEHEVLRLRWEIERTRGSVNWYSDVTYPFGGTASLGGHIGQVGSGTATATNPHAVNIVDTGASVIFDAVRSFTGMTSNSDTSPTYGSTYYVTQGVSLETAVGELDTALNSVLGTAVFRRDYGPYDRSSLSATERANTPITISHFYGRKPVVNVIDETTEGMNYYGLYSSPTYDVEIDYPDNDTIRIWTEAEVVSVIAFF